MTTQLEQKFIQTYNNHQIPAKEIPEQLGITQYKYYKLRNQLKKHLKIRPCHRQKNPKRKIKNYSTTLNGKYIIISKNSRYYACVQTIEQAEKFVELMQQCNWDYTKRHEIKKQVKYGGSKK